MTYVVVELCVDCKYTDCAAVCPVEAFHELTDRLYINADTCIDCDACVPECPVEAIFADTNVPENYAHWTQINIDEAPNYPVISQISPFTAQLVLDQRSDAALNFYFSPLYPNSSTEPRSLKVSYFQTSIEMVCLRLTDSPLAEP